MYQGLLLNALICFAITICAITFAYTLRQHRGDYSIKSIPALKSLVSFWIVVGLIYLFTGIRMLAAYSGNQWLDQMLYYAASIPFAFMAMPLVYFIIYVIVGDRTTSWAVSSVFAIFGIIYLGFLFIQGTTTPVASEWGSIIEINSDYALNAYISGLFIVPTSMILGLLAVIIMQKVARPLQYKISMLLVAISLVFDFALSDIIAVADMVQFASRIFVLVGIVLGFLAYFPPLIIKEKIDESAMHTLSLSSEDYIDDESIDCDGDSDSVHTGNIGDDE